MSALFTRSLLQKLQIRNNFNTFKRYNSSLYYTETHETLIIDEEKKEVKIGISDYARKEIGEIVFIEAEVEIGETIEKNDIIGTIESVKASSEIFTPSCGTVIEHNDELLDTISDMDQNDLTEKTFWFIKIQTEQIEELLKNMNYDEYQNYLKYKK
jgi:glycine cleavage system H protein